MLSPSLISQESSRTALNNNFSGGLFYTEQNPQFSRTVREITVQPARKQFSRTDFGGDVAAAACEQPAIGASVEGLVRKIHKRLHEKVLILGDRRGTEAGNFVRLQIGGGHGKLELLVSNLRRDDPASGKPKYIVWEVVVDNAVVIRGLRFNSNTGASEFYGRVIETIRRRLNYV